MSEERIRLVIADDQALITESFKILLETRAPDIEVVGLAQDGREAVALARRFSPDVVLLDVRMPNMDGVQAARDIVALGAGVKVIMLTTFDDDSYVHEALAAGAAGYLLKDISTDELISSIRAATRGAVLMSPTVARRLSRPPGDKDERDKDNAALSILASLGRREIETLRLIVQGFENKEIAERLHVAEQTVKNNASALYTKLGVSGRREARSLALKAGLVRSEELL